MARETSTRLMLVLVKKEKNESWNLEHAEIKGNKRHFARNMYTSQNVWGGCESNE